LPHFRGSRTPPEGIQGLRKDLLLGGVSGTNRGMRGRWWSNRPKSGEKKKVDPQGDYGEGVPKI